MAITTTTRFQLPQWSAGTDNYPGRIGWNDILMLLEGNPGAGKGGAGFCFPSGLIANRPAGGAFGRFYLATDQGDAGRLYYDGGSGWMEVNTNGGGGPGTPIYIGTERPSTDEGTSNRSARADHIHRFPLATSTNHGALSSQWAELLESVAISATAWSLVQRNSWGRVKTADPYDNDDSVSKGYLNTRMASTANATWDKLANTVVLRGSDGTFYVTEPTKNENPATKKYTDSKTSREEWKENARPMPYGLAEIRQVITRLFDYRDDAPPEVAGTTDVLGAYVEQVAGLMPLLATTSDEDGRPERIIDRDMIWPVIRAVQELAAENDMLRARLAAIEERLALS